MKIVNYTILKAPNKNACVLSPSKNCLAHLKNESLLGLLPKISMNVFPSTMNIAVAILGNESV